MEGPHRQRQLNGVEPYGPGPEYRRRGDGHRARRPVAQDHGGRQGRDPAAQRHDQHDGRPAERLRLGGQPRRARGGHRGQTRRPGRGARSRWYLEEPDRLGELDGLESHRSGAEHRRRGDGHRARRPVAQDHGGRQGRDPAAQGHHQHDGGSAERVRVRGESRGPRGRYRGQARRSGRGARCGRNLEGPDRQRQLDGVEPHRPGAEHRGRGDGHRATATSPGRSRST